MNEKSETFDEWAIVEIMGHDRYAGRVSEQAIGGTSFVRIDVPECEGRPAFTKLFGNSAIFSITPVAEDIARESVKRFRANPIIAYHIDVRQPALPYGDECDDDEPDPF